MNKKIYLSLGVFFFLLTVVVSVIFFVTTKNKYEVKTQNVNDQISKSNTELTSIRNDKDKNNYLPDDVIVAFMNELRNDSIDKAKIYVSKEKQDKDLAAWLKIEKMTDINTVDTNYTVNGATATVIYNGYLKNESDSLALTFTLINENSAWKIDEVEVN